MSAGEHAEDRAMNVCRYASIVGAMLAVSGCFTQYEMREFSPPDGSFAISIPAAPQHQSKTLDTPEGKVTLHSYSATFDEVLYGINVSELPPQVANEPNPAIRRQMMAAGRDGMLAANGWRLLSETGDRIDLSISKSVSGSRITASSRGDSHTATVRIFIHNGRAYQVMTVVPKKPSYNQDIYSVKFLDSFKPGT
jgi:hypothetical protein